MRLSLLCTLISLFVLASWVNAVEVVIPDENLEAVLRAKTEIPDEGPITSEDLAEITTLVGMSQGIGDLTGLEYCVNLGSLDLTTNSISGIGPLAGLANLTNLYLTDNNISDISPLAGLTSLSCVNLTGNNISDSSPLEELTNLTFLSLNSNSVSDVSPLAGLASLGSLNLMSNSITDISSLTGLTNLSWLDLRYNPLGYKAITEDIPTFVGRGVYVCFTNRIPGTLLKSSGDGQTGASDKPLPEPLVVQVLDDKGDPFATVPVTFAVTAGGGSLISVDSATDADGLARATLVLGPTPGLNTVEVTAAGITASVTFEATGELWNIPPYAFVDAPQEGIVGEELYFDGSSSFDIDGEIVSYEWSFGDGTPFESVRSGMIVSHAYYTPGIYIVTLTVVDDYGDEGSGTAEVVVKTPSEATDDLIVYIDDLNLPDGLENSLSTSLQSAIDALNSGNYEAAEGKLNSFINSVMAQAGKKLSIEEAEYLTYIVGLVISAIETQYPVQASSIKKKK